MSRRKIVWQIGAIVAGAILGMVVGNAMGVAIHSDNLPFFDALGVAIGISLGFILSLWVSGRM